MMRPRHITLAAVLLPALACRVEAPYVRSNPLDPGSHYAFTLTGPDSTHTRDAEIALALATEPAMPPGTFYMRWMVETWVDEQTREQRDIVNPVGDGLFVAFNATARYRKIWFRLEMGDVPVGFQVWVGQKAAAMALSCSPHTLPPDPCDDVPVARDAIVPIHLALRDPAASSLREVQWAIARAELTSRDPGVVTTLPVTSDAQGIVRVRAVGAGATWVVVRVDDAIDSVRVAVAP